MCDSKVTSTVTMQRQDNDYGTRRAGAQALTRKLLDKWRAAKVTVESGGEVTAGILEG